MKVKRTYPCNHDGKVYGIGEPVEVPDEIGTRWIESGAAETAEPEPAKKLFKKRGG